MPSKFAQTKLEFKYGTCDVKIEKKKKFAKLIQSVSANSPIDNQRTFTPAEFIRRKSFENRTMYMQVRI